MPKHPFQKKEKKERMLGMKGMVNFIAVKIHVQHVLRKLDLSSRVQVAVFASAEGITS